METRKPALAPLDSCSAQSGWLQNGSLFNCRIMIIQLSGVAGSYGNQETDMISTICIKESGHWPSVSELIGCGLQVEVHVYTYMYTCMSRWLYRLWKLGNEVSCARI